MSITDKIKQKIPKIGGTWDKSFILQIVIIIPFALIVVPASFTRTSIYTKDFLSVKDLIPSVFFLAFFYICREVAACNIFVKVARKIIKRKPEWTEDFLQFRIERIGIAMFKAIYFVLISPFGIYLFRNEDWMPRALFGTGKSDLSLLWENFPYVPRVPYLQLYYCIELGYHLHSLVYHLKLPARNDFYECLLHHLTTIFLIVLSYSNNCARIGVLVMILHDVVDAFMYIAKTLMDVTNMVVFLPFYICFMVSYLYFRLWVLPRYVIPGAYDAIHYIPEGAALGYPTWALLNGLLVVLFILHIYWFKLIIDTTVTMLKKEGIVDPHATKHAVDFNKQNDTVVKNEKNE